MNVTEDAWDKECVKELASAIEDALNDLEDFTVRNGPWTHDSYDIDAATIGPRSRDVCVKIGRRSFLVKIARVS